MESKTKQSELGKLYVEKPIHQRIKMYAAENDISMQAVAEMLIKAGFDHILNCAKEK